MYESKILDTVRAVEFVRALNRRRPLLYLDTETTNLPQFGGEAVEVGIVEESGEVVFSSLVRPVNAVSEKARQTHGITDADLAEAPPFADVYDQLRGLLAGRDVLCYGAEYFDKRILDNSCRLAGKAPIDATWYDLLVPYAALYGEWNDYHGSHRYQRLSAAVSQLGLEIDCELHRAAGDAMVLRALFRKLVQITSSVEAAVRLGQALEYARAPRLIATHGG